MSEQVQLSVGQALRDARESQGLTLENVAVRLRLMNRQVEAMETDDFVALGQPVFARGFVRNYARLLGLEPDVLLSRMEGAPAEPATVSHLPPPSPNSWLTSPWFILLLLGVSLAVAVPVALYLWLNSGVDEAPANHAPIMQSRPAPMPAPVTVPAPVPATAVPSIAELPASTDLSAADVPAADSVDATTPVAVTATGALHLEFGADSWTEIKDASGQMLLRKLNTEGSRVDVRGIPPFTVVIGNAAQVKLMYNGRPIDLKPFVDVSVARFTLEE